MRRVVSAGAHTARWAGRPTRGRGRGGQVAVRGQGRSLRGRHLAHAGARAVDGAGGGGATGRARRVRGRGGRGAGGGMMARRVKRVRAARARVAERVTEAGRVPWRGRRRLPRSNVDLSSGR
eukprot:7979117-Pyramimonas_sp.AAC.2